MELDQESKDYFMGIAKLASTRSPDPKKKVGACIVDSVTHNILGIGYNCFPKGCEHYPWDANKRYYVAHAELNAIVNKNTANIKDSIMFSTLAPCCECAKLIAQSHIKKIYYLETTHDHKIEFSTAKKMFLDVGIECIHYVPQKMVKFGETLDFVESTNKRRKLNSS